MEPKKGYWRVCFKCTCCAEVLNWATVMGSHGMCPFCGHLGENAGTVVDTNEVARRWVMTWKRPWWKFWVRNKGYWEYKT